MKILYGTTNPAKLDTMKKSLNGLDIQLISLNDMQGEIPEAREDGETPLENACQKANAYYKAFGIPVFSCDSGLYFYNLPEYSPMTYVRNVNGKRLTDDEMIEYYGGLANTHGDIIAGYQNAICFIYDSDHIYKSQSESLWGNKFIITARPHEKRVGGFPLDSLSKRIDNGKYYYDSPKTCADVVYNGFYGFFSEVFTSLDLI